MIEFENFCMLLKKKHKKFRHVGTVGWMIVCEMVTCQCQMCLDCKQARQAKEEISCQIAILLVSPICWHVN